MIKHKTALNLETLLLLNYQVTSQNQEINQREILTKPKTDNQLKVNLAIIKFVLIALAIDAIFFSYFCLLKQ